MTRKTNLTIDDIAKDLNVSKTTVSRAISGKGRISEATRQRIQDYIRDHNYRPNAAAKALAENKTYNLAFIVPRDFISLDLPHVRQSMSAIAEEAYLKDYNILICLARDDDPTPLLRTLDHRKADAVILARTVENDQMAQILTERNVPFATIGSLPYAYHGKAVVEADHDQRGGCRAFTTDFLRSAQGAIGVLGNDVNYIVNQSRLTGIREALSDTGKTAEIKTGICSDTQCAQAVDQLLRQGVRRFLAMDDEVCMRILEHLRKRQIRVPEDVQLASLFDSDLLAVNKISALHFDAAELGRVACRELLKHLAGEPFDAAPVLGYKIQLRKST